MRAQAMPVILLVKAVEEADPTHALLPLADREHATRETLRAHGLATDGPEALGLDAARRGRWPIGRSDWPRSSIGATPCSQTSEAACGGPPGSA